MIATSRTDYSAAASAIGVTFYGDADDFVEEARSRLFSCALSLGLLSLTLSCSNRTW